MDTQNDSTTDRYPIEIEDDGGDRMAENVQELRDVVVGRRIVSAEKGAATYKEPNFSWTSTGSGLILTLDDGSRFILAETSDCCAYTEVENFLLHADRIDHTIIGVGTTGDFTKWHIYADFGDVLEVEVGWSPGNPFYYGYGFDIAVVTEAVTR